MKKSARSFDPRQEMARPDFEVFHYHDPKMQEVSLHHHDFYEVYCFLSGAVEYAVEGRCYTLQPRDILLIGPMELHRPMVAPEQAYERIVLWIARDYFEALPGGALIRGCFERGRNLYHAEHTQIPQLMEKLAQEFAGDSPDCALAARGLLYQLLAELRRLVFSTPGDGGETEEQGLAAQVLAYIGEHYREELSLDSLAAAFFVSKSYLSHLFRQSVGTGVYRCILLKRLQHARKLLSEGAAPGAVCRSCGFADYANFYRAFRKVYGAGPNELKSRPESL